VNPQIWPQTNLQYEYVSKGVTFQQLDFKLFVAGELEIISSKNIGDKEKKARVALLKKKIVYYRSLSDKTYFFDLPFLRDLRFEILNDTELHDLLESLAGNDFRIFLFFFSFLALIDSTDNKIVEKQLRYLLKGKKIPISKYKSKKTQFKVTSDFSSQSSRESSSDSKFVLLI
jgi:hypothetical protein